MKLSAVRSALRWSLAERFASLVAAIVSTMLLARLLTPAEVGVFSICASFTLLAGILRDFGVNEYLIQEKDLTREKMKAAFGVAIAISWFIGLVVYVSGNWVASFFGERGIAHVLAVLSLNFLLLPFAAPAFTLLNRELAFRKVFAIQVSSNLTSALVAPGLAYLGYSYMSLAWGPVAGIAVQTLLVTCFRPRDTLLWPSLRSAEKVLRFGGIFVSSRIAETLSRTAHEFVIARQFDFAMVGQFSRAYGLIDLFYNTMATAILRVASPSFAIDHRAGVDLAPTFARGTAIFTCVAWPFFGFLAITSNEIIQLLFGQQWMAAAPIASILSISMMPIYLWILAPGLLASTGNVKHRLHVSAWSAGAHITGLIAASFVGIYAMTVVFGLSNLLQLTLYARKMQITLNASLWQLFGPCLRSFAVTLFTTFTGALALWVCRLYSLTNYMTVINVGLCGGLAWAIAVQLSKHPILTEFNRAKM